MEGRTEGSKEGRREGREGWRKEGRRVEKETWWRPREGRKDVGEHGRKEGRVEGRVEGRKEGRKERREDGVKGNLVAATPSAIFWFVSSVI
jgi:hypothetical protein